MGGPLSRLSDGLHTSPVDCGRGPAAWIELGVSPCRIPARGCRQLECFAALTVFFYGLCVKRLAGAILTFCASLCVAWLAASWPRSPSLSPLTNDRTISPPDEEKDERALVTASFLLTVFDSCSPMTLCVQAGCLTKTLAVRGEHAWQRLKPEHLSHDHICHAAAPGPLLRTSPSFLRTR